MPDKYQLLKHYWGYTAFRPLQDEIVDAVAAGHDTLVLLPTGGGKSLCYQLPALLREGLCLVVSPLIALMKDQVQQLQNRHLKAACLVSGMSGEAMTSVLYNAIAGELKYLYVSPERLRSRQFIEHLRQMKVGLIAVDEAHCISQWGYDFRPPYLQIADIRAYHPQAPVVALTATATSDVVEDICLRLKMKDCRRFCSSFYRENLTYKVLRGDDKTTRLLMAVSHHEGSGIVYVRTRRQTRSVADLLSSHGVSATFYHAGLDVAERDRRQAQWMDGQYRVMVATNAFGMGIDKPDVRFVIHMDVPDSLEAYFQEAGRAGRDGQPAEALLLYAATDRESNEHNLAMQFPDIKYIRGVYRALCNYYRLPVGGGADSQFDFQMEEICRNYHFAAAEFYSACRFLEREGLIAMHDSEDTVSTLYIQLSREELYRFQVDHQLLGTLLQTVIRLYSGLFTEPTPIDERLIGSRCLMEPGEVGQRLMQMHEMHLLQYRPRSEKPQLVFVTPCVDANDLNFDTTDYNLLQQAARRRWDAVRHYVEHDDECRSRQLLAYFGEKESEDCGRCDVCLGKSVDRPSAREAVMQTLKEGPMNLNTLFNLLTDAGVLDVQAAVRQLMDEGVVKMDGNFSLSIR